MVLTIFLVFSLFGASVGINHLHWHQPMSPMTSVSDVSDDVSASETNVLLASSASVPHSRISEPARINENENFVDEFDKIFSTKDASEKKQLVLNMETPSQIVEGFLFKLKNAIYSNDVVIMADLFEPNFIYQGCEKVYTKNDAVVYLVGVSKLPENQKWGLTLRNHRETQNTITFELFAVGFLPQPVYPEFTLNKFNQMLVAGKTKYCKKNGFYMF